MMDLISSAASTPVVMNAGLCEDEELKQVRQVAPIRLALLNQTDFPIAMPVLQLLFARNGFLRRSELFHMEQEISDKRKRPQLPYFFGSSTYQCIVRIDANAPVTANMIAIAIEYLRNCLALPDWMMSIQAPVE
jgi:hypothetical protein